MGQHQASGAGDGRSSADQQDGEPGRADEVLQLLVGAAEQLAVEDQVTPAHRLLAVLLDEHAPDRLLVGRGRRAAAGPALLAVARLDLVSEKEGLLPKVEPAARVGLDREAVDEPEPAPAGWLSRALRGSWWWSLLLGDGGRSPIGRGMNELCPMPGCSIERITPDGPGFLHITAHGARPGGRCPDCGRASRAVHSRYRRRPADLPSL